MDCYRYRRIYINFIITAKQNTQKGIQRTKRKEYTQSNTEKQQTTKEEIKRRRKEQRVTITTTKMMNKMVIGT